MTRLTLWPVALWAVTALSACTPPPEVPPETPTVEAVSSPTGASVDTPTTGAAVAHTIAEEIPGGYTVRLPASWEGKYEKHASPPDAGSFAHPKAQSVTDFLYRPADPGHQPTPLLTVSTYLPADWTAVASQEGPPPGIKVDETAELVIVATTPPHNPYGPATPDAQAFDALFLALDLEQAFVNQGTAMDDGATETPLAELKGTRWAWQETALNNDTTLKPPDPGAYTVAFEDGGRLMIQADCNRASGSYRQDGSQLTIEAAMMTRIACAEGSLSDEFVEQLNLTYAGLMLDHDLILDLKMDTGSMRFSPLP